MNYRGMVVIDNEDYGESMELVKCIAKKAKELVEVLGNASMAERRHDEFEDDDMPPIDMMYRKGGSGRGRGTMRSGRYGY